jgi:hypothetical protein
MTECVHGSRTQPPPVRHPTTTIPHTPRFQATPSNPPSGVSGIHTALDEPDGPVDDLRPLHCHQCSFSIQLPCLAMVGNGHTKMRETTPTHLFRWPVRDHGVCRGHRPIAAGGVPCGGRKHQVPVFEEKPDFQFRSPPLIVRVILERLRTRAAGQTQKTSQQSTLRFFRPSTKTISHWQSGQWRNRFVDFRNRFCSSGKIPVRLTTFEHTPAGGVRIALHVSVRGLRGGHRRLA